MDRRSFLSLFSGALASQVAWGVADSRQQTLVLIELKGGNDGLNTVVPFTDPALKTLRPNISLPTDKLIKLDEKIGLHPALAPLTDVWKSDQLAIVQGLGYEQPNRSHFRSHDIWSSASASDERKESGWVADSLSGSGEEVQAVVFGNRTSLLQGRAVNYISMRRTAEFLNSKLPDIKPISPSANPAQKHVHDVLRDTLAYQERLRKVAGKLKLPAEKQGGAFGKEIFGKQLQDAALLINSGLAPKIITLHIGGFDTHANQSGRHKKLLGQLAVAVAAFREELIASDRWKDTLVVTWSEFGRRVAENGSGGTDHGTAAPQFVLGGRVKGGLHGQQPSLTDLQNDDMVHSVDFKQLYGSLSEQWLGLAPESAGDRREFPALDLIKKV